MSKTIFILGAGASHSYHFPLGQGLVDEIITKLSPTSSIGNTLNFDMNSPLVKLLLKHCDGSFMLKFVNTLRDSEANSIDFFLSHNEKYREIGKLCIAYFILDHQRRLQKTNSIKGGWYKLFWSEINSMDIDNFDFSIYTFNYDRSLSLYLKKSLMNMFGWNETDSNLQQYMQRIPITHLHGSVDIESYDIDIEAFFLNMNYDQLLKICNQINVIYEAEINEAFSKLHQEIAHVKHIVFLGFGFHPDNLKRLGLEKIRSKNVTIYSTAYGMTNLQSQTKIKDRIVNSSLSRNSLDFRIGLPMWNCEDFLTNEFSFQNLFV